jgi:hypothetical protein
MLRGDVVMFAFQRVAPPSWERVGIGPRRPLLSHMTAIAALLLVGPKPWTAWFARTHLSHPPPPPPMLGAVCPVREQGELFGSWTGRPREDAFQTSVDAWDRGAIRRCTLRTSETILRQVVPTSMVEAARGGASGGNPAATRRAPETFPVVRLRASRAQHAELVALGIGQHDPAHVALTDVDPGGPELEDALDLLILIPVPRAEVQVKPVLDGLGLGDGEEVDAGRRPIGRLERDDLAIFLGDLVAQDRGPELREPPGVRAVDRNLSELAGHGDPFPWSTLTLVPCPRHLTWGRCRTKQRGRRKRRRATSNTFISLVYGVARIVSSGYEIGAPVVFPG